MMHILRRLPHSSKNFHQIFGQGHSDVRRITNGAELSPSHFNAHYRVMELYSFKFAKYWTNVFQPDMAYVGLSRVRSISDIAVTKFCSNCITPSTATVQYRNLNGSIKKYRTIQIH